MLQPCDQKEITVLFVTFFESTSFFSKSYPNQNPEVLPTPSIPLFIPFIPLESIPIESTPFPSTEKYSCLIDTLKVYIRHNNFNHDSTPSTSHEVRTLDNHDHIIIYKIMV